MEQSGARGSAGFMNTVAAAIVRYRFVIFALFAVAAVYCALGVGKVRVSSQLTAFLPPETETRRGLDVMGQEFVTYGTASVMVSNVSYELAEQLAERISEMPHVTDVVFDGSKAHFSDSSALFNVTFDAYNEDPAVSRGVEQVKTLLAGYDVYVYTMILSGYTEQLAQEMTVIILLAVLVIAAVLLFTSRSYFEVVIFGVVFAVAALLNMGTNFWLGEISSITNSVAVILQLALAIDYAIIFAHRYQDEAARCAIEREALVHALSKSITEISSSSLTTVSGLAALTLMQFRLGYDLGMVLAKGIVCSMLTVFLLMPGLILLFPAALRRTAHRSFIPSVYPWGRFLVKSKLVFVVLFLLLLPAAIYCSGKTEYAFSDTAVSELIESDSRTAIHKIRDTFAPDTMMAVIMPAGNYEAEKEIISEISALPQIKSATGLANIAIGEHVLTDMFTPRLFSEFMSIDYEQALLLFQAYGAEHGEFQAIFGSPAEYEVPLVDLVLYLFEKIDQGIVSLEQAQQEQLDAVREDLERGVAQLRGEHYDRIILMAAVPTEGEQSIALVEQVRGIAERVYGEGTVLMIGDITAARDLRDSYKSDGLFINLLTIAFVFLILLFTFRSIPAALILVFVIQGSIWINFSFAYLLDMHPSFVTNMIVSAIQMGATIDYAIVLMSRYLALKKQHPPKEAMVLAVNESFPTVMTSGTIMTVAGLLIALRVSDVYVGHIGLAVGRGAFISVVLVLTVLPQMIVLFDKVIEKTTFRRKEGSA